MNSNIPKALENSIDIGYSFEAGINQETIYVEINATGIEREYRYIPAATTNINKV